MSIHIRQAEKLQQNQADEVRRVSGGDRLWGNEADGFASRVENEQAWKAALMMSLRATSIWILKTHIRGNR